MQIVLALAFFVHYIIYMGSKVLTSKPESNMTNLEIGKTYEITFLATARTKMRTKVVTISGFKPVEGGKTCFTGILSGVTQDQLEADPWAADFSFVLPNEGVVASIIELASHS